LIFQVLRDVANAQRPDAETYALIKEIKRSGHEVWLMSNIGEEFLEDIKTKQPKVSTQHSATCFTLWLVWCFQC
jgi:hypothetical protein